MTERALALIFHVGLIPSVFLLTRGSTGSMRFLLPLGIVHILALFAAGSSMSPARARMVVQTLHKAGFLHTLLGLASAIVALGSGWTGSGPAPPSTTLVLAPIGTALVPHILGVWLGHAIELRRAAAEVDLDQVEQKLVEVGAAAFRLLDLLQQQIATLHTHYENLGAAVAGIAAKCAVAGTEVDDAIEELSQTGTTAAHAARDFRAALTQVTTATSQIGVVHRQLVGLLESMVPATADTGARP